MSLEMPTPSQATLLSVGLAAGSLALLLPFNLVKGLPLSVVVVVSIVALGAALCGVSLGGFGLIPAGGTTIPVLNAAALAAARLALRALGHLLLILTYGCPAI